MKTHISLLLGFLFLTLMNETDAQMGWFKGEIWSPNMKMAEIMHDIDLIALSVRLIGVTEFIT